jgi:hypothetical protein
MIRHASIALFALVVAGATGCTDQDVIYDYDNDGYPDGVDCDSNDPTVHPDAEEIPYDGIDQDCDDEDLTDVDGDGHDWDGAGGGDCDDEDDTVYPGATELCDGADNDCNGLVDEDDPAGLHTWYQDADGDGYGDAEASLEACAPPQDHVEDGTDCDDTDDTIHPDAEELCDGLDTDCDELIPDEEADGDADGWSQCDGDCAEGNDAVHPGATEQCNGADDDCDGIVPEDEYDDDGDGVMGCDGDCDDGDDTVWPGAAEGCDGIDTDCDGTVPDDEIDDDGDGAAECEGDCDDADGDANLLDGDADGYSTCDGDCNDSDDTVNPGAIEIPGDGTDQDCDGHDGIDLDGDGYADASQGGDDCDDNDPDVHPGAVEICNGVDDDCDPATLEDADADGDGFSPCDGDCDDAMIATNPLAVEVCDGRDEDCNGTMDDGCAACSDWVPMDYLHIQDAVNGVPVGAVVCVSPGLYSETVDFVGKDIQVLGTGGPGVTTIHAGGAGSVVSFVTGESADAVLRGFTLTGGFASYGGGVLTNFSAPTLRDLWITGNDADTSGGGLSLNGDSPTLMNVSVGGNVAQYNGGGIDLASSDAILEDVAVVGNEADFGGGLYLANSTPTMTHVWVADNTASADGGGLYLWWSSPVMIDFAITGNEALLGYGGGAVLSNAQPDMGQGVVMGNVADSGGGFVLVGSDMLSLLNVIVADNEGLSGGGGIMGLYASTLLDHCNFHGNIPENFSWFKGDPIGLRGNISQPPLFLDTTSPSSWMWDLHLDPSSPCVDAGEDFTTDPDSGPSDIGMYGGPESDDWDLDGDGAPSWWQPGPYDPVTYPGDGWDCDDHDSLLGPGRGC